MSESLGQNVKTWIVIESKIKEINKELKELKEKKINASEMIIEELQKHKKEHCILPNGEILLIKENVSYSNIKKEDIQEAVKEVLNKVQEQDVSKEAITKLPIQTAETLFESRESKTKLSLKKVKKLP